MSQNGFLDPEQLKSGEILEGSKGVLKRKTSELRKKRPPIGSMYGISPYIYHKFMPNVGKYPIHGSYAPGITCFSFGWPVDAKKLKQASWTAPTVGGE